MEHDGNPMIDLQAMDKAHRIGQKKNSITNTSLVLYLYFTCWNCVPVVFDLN